MPISLKKILRGKVGEKTPYRGSPYLECFLEKESRLANIQFAIKHLRSIQFDAVAFSGNSGAMIGGALCVILDKHPILVRKKISRDAHSKYIVEGFFPREPMRYIIVDDFVHTGNTVRNIFSRIKRFNPYLECVGVYQFDPATEKWENRFLDIQSIVPHPKSKTSTASKRSPGTKRIAAPCPMPYPAPSTPVGRYFTNTN